MTTVLHQTMTAEAFAQLPDAGNNLELIKGEVIETMPPGGQHGAIAGTILFLLRLWMRQGAAGYGSVESGYLLSRHPDTVRGPDVSYVRAERIPAEGIPEGFWHLAPDLAVEVVSPSETAEEVREKVRDFLAAGTPLVWIVYPRSREVIVHTPDGLARTYASGDTLEFPEVLPGFRCVVAEIFE